VRIATFNVNNVNKRLPNLLRWLAAAQPDVVCLQELKAEDGAFPIAAIRDAGYGAVWHGQRSWNGVAILARGADPVETRRALPGDPSDVQSRYIEAAVGGVLIASLYLPNGNPQPGPKFDYKLAWFERLIAHAASLIASDLPVVLAGDYNVVPTPADMYASKSHDDNALVQPQSRAAYARLVAQAGQMRCGPSTQTSRCTRSGPTCGMAGDATPAGGSTICCSAPRSPGSWPRPGWTGRCAAKRAPAITPPPG
jgi:exodeoxyribonuclease-3